MNCKVELPKKILEQYMNRTRKARKLYEKGERYLPGGNTRSAVYFYPYPIYIEKANGSTLWDVDGNSYADFLFNYTSLIHGHCHPKIIDAAKEQLMKGSAYAAPTELEIRLAEKLCERIPSMELVMFCNSGTEATMATLHAARASTGKNKLLKIEGAYHGSHDYACISNFPSLEEVGPLEKPYSASDQGVSDAVASEVFVTPFNNKEVTEKIIKSNRKELAAVIVEPCMAGANVLPQNGYLRFLRDITSENGILLIFDEVQTFRISKGGAQQKFGVVPDMTALGKTIGGGFPVGAFGGREDIMLQFSPKNEKCLPRSGTFNANPVTMSSGLVTLDLLTPEVYDRLENMGKVLKEKILGIFETAKLKGTVNQIGSLINLHFKNDPVYDYRTAVEDPQLMYPLHLSLLNHGVFIARRGAFNISTVTTYEDLEYFCESFKASISDLPRSIRRLYLRTAHYNP